MADRFVLSDEYSKKVYDEKKMTQKDACIDYLKRYGSITPLEALNAFNCFRLSATIFELRREGWIIETDINDGKKKYAIYRLLEGEKNNG